MLHRLLAVRRFAPLFWCQFLSSLNDNFIKTLTIMLVLFGTGGPNAGVLVTLASATFVAPFFLFSALGGQLADRYDKALVTRRLKLAEIAASVFGAAGFIFSSVPCLFAAIFLFGLLGALFGPAKYGMLPDHLKPEELPAGNALVEGGTFISILLGTIIAGVMYGVAHDEWIVAGMMMVVSVGCWLTARMIPPTGEAAPTIPIEANVFRSTWELVRALAGEGRLLWGGMVASWFWLVGSVILSLMPTLVKDTLGGTQDVVTVLLTVFSIAIAFGAAAAAWLSGGRIVLIPTLISSFFLAVFAADVGIATYGLKAAAATNEPATFFTGTGLRITIDLAFCAFFSGMFIVPVIAALQSWAGPERRSRVIGAANVLNALFMVAAGIVVAVLQAAGMSVPALMILLGVTSLAATVWIYRTMPIPPFADFLSMLFRVFYRLEVEGLDHIATAPPGTVIAVNHVSFLDAGLILCLMEKKPVFAIDQTIARRWWVKPFLHLARAVPLDPTKPLATRTLVNALKAGERVVIFPEGRITVTGGLMKIYDGAAMIADKADAPIVPVRIDGLEATPFSRLSTTQVRRRFFPRVRVAALPPRRLAIDPALKGRARRRAAGAALYETMSDLVFRTAVGNRTIVEAVIAAASEHGRKRVAIEDPLSGTMTYGRLLAGTAVLARALQPLGQPGKAVGVMLPNANAVAVTVLATLSAGLVPAMLNFTAGAANVVAACRAAALETVLTSRAFIEKAQLGELAAALEGVVRLVYLEDIRAAIGPFAKLRGALAAGKPLVKRGVDDAAAILFTSGSEGRPKGVVLSHANILANVAQAQARIDFGRGDKLFNVLPPFHAFGLSIGILLPLVTGVRTYLYPSPLHYRIIPELIYATNSTVLFGTDTFLAGYARAADSYDLRSLRLVLAGAERVKDATRQVYQERFGIRILEGYGVTEAAPAIAFNTPMFNRFGTVGRLMPGVEARLEPVEGLAEGGRLHVRGPNVMIGYLKSERPGIVEPPQDGWHDTGDIVTIDADGFVRIHGRAKRFAKIAGEMVSLAAVEALAADVWPEALSAAVALPDPRKGERIVLATTEADASRGAFHTAARARGATELMIPADIVVIGEVPLLGSGKVDYQTLHRLVQEPGADAAQATG